MNRHTIPDCVRTLTASRQIPGCRSSRALLLAAVYGLLLLCPALHAYAVDRAWNQLGPGAFVYNTAANWIPSDAFPAAGDNASFGLNGNVSIFLARRASAITSRSATGLSSSSTSAVRCSTTVEPRRSTTRVQPASSTERL